MNTDLETIENYVNGQLSSDKRLEFEKALHTDPAVADALAFYLLTKQVMQEETREQPTSAAREQRRAELNALRKKSGSTPEVELMETEPVNRPLWSFPMRWVAAASIILVLGLGYFFYPTASTPDASQLADQYMTDHFMQLPTTMDGSSSGSPSVDSLKLGIGLFNKGQLTDADVVFQQVLSRQPTMDTALKFAGIVSLRQGNYDKAITYFHLLSQRTDLFANPGMFYEALTYLKRGRPLDKSEAKKLLNGVITNNLEGKGEAEKLLKQMN